jgi:2-(1,2-epoxy-1,2-dihydrophenyl)acetyl-CoA isomerase
MNYQNLQAETSDGVATLRLNRPEVLNALNVPTALELVQALEALRRDKSIKLLVVTGAGRAFCAGGDIGEMQASARRFFRVGLSSLHRAIALLGHFPQPTIGAIRGPAVGAGMNLALACDLRIASDTLKFQQAFVHVGLTPDCGGTYWLPRLVGSARAAEFVLTGRDVLATEALSLGLVNQVVPDAELDAVAMAAARKLAALPRELLARQKRLLLAGQKNNLAVQLRAEKAAQFESARSAYAQARLQAFLAQRGR